MRYRDQVASPVLRARKLIEVPAVAATVIRPCDPEVPIVQPVAVVIVMTHLAAGVAAGDEIRVTYNRVPGNNAYFCTRKCAKKLAGKSRCIVKCMCEPDGCPLKRYYVTDRVPSAATP